MSSSSPPVICWSCEKNAGGGMLCAACGALQPPDRSADYFRVFGLPRAYALDSADLERRYKEMTKILHPDRYARADARARRASLERSVQLNDAWRTLSSPVRRAEYLLSLQGIDVGGRQARAGEQTQPMSPALLMEVMELRESLAEASKAGDTAEVAALAASVQDRHDKTVAAVAEEFAVPKPDLALIATRLISIRYYRRFLDEVQAQRESQEAATSND